MKSIETAITINATPDKVWSILMDFENYPNWNPFIQSIKGERKLGSKIEASLGLGDKGMTFNPTIQHLEPNKKFEWLGHLWTKGIFDGRHTFELKSMDNNTTQLIHKETFSGVFSGIILNMVKKDTIAGFQAMNEALKATAERA